MLTSRPTGHLCTRAYLTEELRNLGVQHGEILLVHSSLKSLGGAETAVLSLLDCLGDDGTLVVPSQTGDNSDPAGWECPPVPDDWWPLIRAWMPPYDPQTSRTRAMAVICETVRTWPGAVRSSHPQTSFAAVGHHATLPYGRSCA